MLEVAPESPAIADMEDAGVVDPPRQHDWLTVTNTFSRISLSSTYCNTIT